MDPTESSESSEVSQLYEPYDRVMQATATLLQRLADEVPGVESLLVRHERRGKAPRSFEVTREFSLVIDVDTVVAVRVHWYVANERGRSPEHELLYDHVQPTVADDGDQGCQQPRLHLPPACKPYRYR